jgi:hypothetical protein
VTALVASAAVRAETVVAPFTAADAVTTAGSYSGYVLARVSGIGQSAGTNYNDAFYLFDPSVPGFYFNSSAYYQLTFDSAPLVPFNPSREMKYFVYGSLPAYSTGHVYNFIFDTGLAVPAPLHFGVSDGNFADNTGAYTISLLQLDGVPEPASWAMMITGFGLAGTAMRRRRVLTTA